MNQLWTKGTNSFLYKLVWSPRANLSFFLETKELCFFNKGYYLCCCNISFSCDADFLQGCSFIEKSISKHIFAEPQGALLLAWKASFWWCVRSGLILWESAGLYECVCEQVRREAHAFICSLCLIAPLQCFITYKESLYPGEQHNAHVIKHKAEKTVCLIWFKWMTIWFLPFTSVRGVKTRGAGHQVSHGIKSISGCTESGIVL